MTSPDAGPVDLPAPSLRRPFLGSPRLLRVVLGGDRHYEVSLVNVGLACCSVEVMAAVASAEPAGEPRGEPAAGARQVLVVSGTCTDVMAPALARVYAALPEPRHVVSFGVCTCSGGPYWDSYSVTKGIDQVVPVDVHVPGCPPRPEALIDALRELERLIDSGEVAP